jgi:calcineurin-like phosphoesterase family protein
MIIINDLHLGVNRVSGTTPQSREDLRNYVFAEFDKLLHIADGHDLCILGDLFDSFEVAPRDWLESYLLLANWCANNPDNFLILVAGNHDVSLKGSKVSSFETLATVLNQQFDNVEVVGIDGFAKLYRYGGRVFILAHHRNQDTFDLSLNSALVEAEKGDYVLLHANYHNKFAEQADHSLNVSEAQALEFTKKGVDLLFAHEHHHRREIPHGTPADGGSVVCLGNQIPTSVSDVLGRADKFYWELWEEGLRKHKFWEAKDNYAELDWRSLPQDSPAKFIRVVGDAVNAEAAQVIDAIHRFRQKSNAFVITNAVKIEGIADIESLPSTFEVAKSFDVMEFVYGQLNEAEAEVIRKITEGLE